MLVTKMEEYLAKEKADSAAEAYKLQAHVSVLDEKLKKAKEDEDKAVTEPEKKAACKIVVQAEKAITANEKNLRLWSVTVCQCCLLQLGAGLRSNSSSTRSRSWESKKRRLPTPRLPN